MDARTGQLVEQLTGEHSLPLDGYAYLLEHADAQAADELARHAAALRQKVYGTAVFARGLIEVSSYCRNDCLYCGLRASNRSCARYRLSDEQILDCVEQGYHLGFRTFVMQGGEDPRFDDARVCALVRSIKDRHPDCAVTLSLGERSHASYQALRDAGADRYLLRHETATSEHYAQLHPAGMALQTRMQCLRWLKDLGFATGAGFMVGSPGQTTAHLAADLKFIEGFQPEMCGIGPFIPHHATPFAHEPAGTLAQTLLLLSIVRLIAPNVLLPATTALGSIHPQGREQGILAGANVVMPNLSPGDVRAKYELYDGKVSSGLEAAESWRDLDERMKSIGYHLAVDRGDPATLATPPSKNLPTNRGRVQCSSCETPEIPSENEQNRSLFAQPTPIQPVPCSHTSKGEAQ